MKKGCKNPRLIVDVEKVEQMARVCDNEEEIALALGISYRTLQRRKKEFVEFGEAIKRGKAKANIFVGGRLMEQIKAGNIAATIFWMKSRCGWKETQRQEVTGANGAPLQMAPATIELTERQKQVLDKVLDEEF